LLAHGCHATALGPNNILGPRNQPRSIFLDFEHELADSSSGERFLDLLLSIEVVLRELHGEFRRNEPSRGWVPDTVEGGGDSSVEFLLRGFEALLQLLLMGRRLRQLILQLERRLVTDEIHPRALVGRDWSLLPILPEAVGLSQLLRDLAPKKMVRIVTPSEGDDARLAERRAAGDIRDHLASHLLVPRHEPERNHRVRFAAAHRLGQFEDGLVGATREASQAHLEELPHAGGDVVFFEEGSPVSRLLDEIA
jgi:hypothetical protein